MAVFAPLDVLSLVRCAIGPRFQALPVLLVLLPAATILGPVQVTVGAEAVSFVVLPVAIVNVAISVDQATLSVGFVLRPVAFVHRAVWPDLDSLSLTRGRALGPLALIPGTILQDDHLSAFTWAKLFLKLDVIVGEATKLFAHFLHTSKQRGIVKDYHQ